MTLYVNKKIKIVLIRLTVKLYIKSYTFSNKFSENMDFTLTSNSVVVAIYSTEKRNYS